MSYMNREHLLNLADRCQAGAEQLTYEAEHAAEVLADRGYPNADPQQWAARKTAAAAAACQYAEGLRAEAASLSEGQRPTTERIQQAEKVAHAAELGGILIDGSRIDAAAVANPFTSAEQRQAIEEHGRAEREAIESSGLFEHVAEPGQVPFWQLGGHTSEQTGDDTAAQTPMPATDDIDEY